VVVCCVVVVVVGGGAAGATVVAWVGGVLTVVCEHAERTSPPRAARSGIINLLMDDGIGSLGSYLILALEPGF
jgi:hypothetical protein